MTERVRLSPLERLNKLTDRQITIRILGTDDPRDYAQYIGEFTVGSIVEGITDLLHLKQADANKIQHELLKRARNIHYMWNSSVAKLNMKKTLTRHEQELMQEVERVQKIIDRQHEVIRLLQEAGPPCLHYSDVIEESLPIDNVIGLVASSDVPYGQLWIPSTYAETVVGLTDTFQSFVGGHIYNPATGVEIILSVGQEYTTHGKFMINPHTRELLEQWTIDGMRTKRETGGVRISLVVPKLITEITVEPLMDDEKTRQRITPKLISFKVNSEGNGVVSVGLELPAFGSFIRVKECKCDNGSTVGGFVKGLQLQEYTTTVIIA